MHLLLCSILFFTLIFIDMVLLIFHKEDNIFFWRFPLFKLLEYGIGIGLGMLYKRYNKDKVSKIFINANIDKNFIDILLTGLVAACMILYPHNTFYADFLGIPVISLYIFYLCISGKSILEKFLSNGFILFLSSISFEGYLIHYVVIQLLKSYCLKYVNTICGIIYIFILLFVLTVLFSYLYKIFMKRILFKFD